MRVIHSAQFELSIDGVPHSYRDRKDLALQSAQILKARNPNSVVKLKDLQTEEETVIAFKRGRQITACPSSSARPGSAPRSISTARTTLSTLESGPSAAIIRCGIYTLHAGLIFLEHAPQWDSIVLLLAVMSLMSACSSREYLAGLHSADQLSADVNRCVIDVRDKGDKDETSENCRSLGEIAKQYIAAGGLKESAPCRADRLAESARARAWMAVAVSKSGDPNLTVW